jgi:hypothetical protein
MESISWQEFDPFPAALRANQSDRRTALPLIDIGRALDLLAMAVKHRGAYFVYVAAQDQRCLYTAGGGPQCRVGRALSLAGIDDDELEMLGHRGVRDLYREGLLPAQLTLGALAVLDAAQRGQDRGYTWGEALEFATGVADRFLDLIPETLSHSR